MKAQEKVPKENAGKALPLHPHTPPLKTDENVSLRSPLSTKLLGPAVQHGVNFLQRPKNLEALPAPFAFLGLQVNGFWGNQ